MTTTKQLIDALLSSDLTKLNEVLINIREALNTINSIDIEQIERVGEAAAKTIQTLALLHGSDGVPAEDPPEG